MGGPANLQGTAPLGSHPGPDKTFPIVPILQTTATTEETASLGKPQILPVQTSDIRSPQGRQ